MAYNDSTSVIAKWPKPTRSFMDESSGANSLPNTRNKNSMYHFGTIESVLGE